MPAQWAIAAKCGTLMEAQKIIMFSLTATILMLLFTICFRKWKKKHFLKRPLLQNIVQYS